MTEAVVSAENTPDGKIQREFPREEWGTEEHQQEIRATQLAEENMRLRKRQSQLQDQLGELKRQLSAERSARQGLAQELGEAKERLQRAKDNLDKKKKEHGDVSLQLCTVTAERDELEAKVNEVWHSMAVMEETVRAKDMENKALREVLDNEKKERTAQQVLMNAMVAQLDALEQQVLDGSGAGEQQRRLGEETLRSVKEEVEHVACVLEYLANMSFAVSLDQVHDQHMLLLADGNGVDDDGGTGAGVHGAADVGLNSSDPEKAAQSESRVKRNTRVLGPIYQAVRHLRQQIQRHIEEQHVMQQERRVLESHISTLKDELRHMGDEGDDVREKLLWSEAQRAQITEALESMRQARGHEEMQATETRKKVAALLHCMDDWCIIEQHIIDTIEETQRLQDAVLRGRREHGAYVAQKEKEVDAIVDSHQREIDSQQQQLEQARHECEQLKRAALVEASAATTVVVNSGGVGGYSMELQREHEALKVKHQEMLKYMEGELEPLVRDQAEALHKERQKVNELCGANDALRLEVKLLNSVRMNTSGRLSLFEALVLTLRVLSGAMADMREMAQQRTALTHYILAYERIFGGLNIWGESMGPRLALRFRRAVVAVLAVHRLMALQRVAWRRGGVIPSRERGAGRIRLPPETCCLVRGGLIHLPPVQRGESAMGSLEEEQNEKEENSGVHFVAEQDLQLPTMILRTGYSTANDDVISQGLILHSFLDNLLSFVAVPSAIWPRRDVRQSLSRRLTNGLRALQHAPPPPPPPGEGKYMNIKSQHLLHLPPRAPGRTSAASSFWESTSNVLPAASKQPLDYDREDAYTFSRMKASTLSNSMEHMQRPVAGSGAGVYPVPQPTTSHVQSAWDIEESLHQSFLRDAENNSVLQESQIGGGFASQVLNAIRALDQRVLGALERNANVGDRRPQR